MQVHFNQLSPFKDFFLLSNAMMQLKSVLKCKEGFCAKMQTNQSATVLHQALEEKE